MAKKKNVIRSALKCVKTTTIDVKKIADHYGIIGSKRQEFCALALKLRENLWNEMDAKAK